MRIIVVAVVLLAVLAATACGGGTGAAGDRTLRVQVSGEPEEIAVYRALVGAYQKANPDARVRLIGVAGKQEQLARLGTAFATGDPPEVFLINFREYAQFVRRGALAPVGPLLRDTDPRDYYSQPVEAFTLGGELQCMPQNISSLVVYYNRELFEKAGVECPEPGWTWKEFAATARGLTRDGVHGVGIEPSLIRAAPFVWANGGEIVDDEREPSRLTLGEPRAAEALRFLVDLAGDAMPGKAEIAAQDLETRFTTGKLGMILSSRKSVPAFREVSGLDFDVAPLPAGRERASILHSDGYCVAAGRDGGDPAMREEAARFISFATGRRGQTITALGGRTVPSLKAVAESPAFLDPAAPPENAQAFLGAIPAIRRTPVLSTWPEIEDVAEAELTRAMLDGAPLAEVLPELDRRTRPLFARARGGG